MSTQTHDVLIIGGGQAGVSLAARLRRDKIEDVAIIDPVHDHVYRPLLSYVGGGQAKLARAIRPQSSVIPRGVTWYRDRAASVDATARSVTTAGGLTLVGEDLVVCPGVTQDWDAVPGSREAVFSAAGASNYVDERVEHTWALISGLTSGRAVFVVDDGPVPCAGAGLKPLFLAADLWRRHGLLDQVEVTVLLGWDTIFGIDRVDRQLARAADRYGIRVRTGVRLRSVDAEARNVLATTDLAGDEVFGYDLLHLVPRHRAPSWVAESGLDGPTTAGMIDIDPETLAHRQHDHVWGLGDAADVQASRSGGALRKQAAVVADNLQLRRAGQPMVIYSGYSTAPITVSRDRVVLAEFDRAGRLTPSVPLIDLVKPRRLTWFYDRFLQPLLYWYSILKGRIKS